MLFSYCTNLHPGESWEETFAALRHHVPGVRRKLRRAATDPFPLGLRLSAVAAAQLCADKALLRQLRRWLEDENLLAFTINGFPYGPFHGQRVKEQVFAPDWSTPERVAYTSNLFALLAELLPEGAEGSVSSLPGSFSEFVAADPSRRPAILANLRRFAIELDELSSINGLDLHLGLEPEPLGLFDDTAGTIRFFDELTDGLAESERARLLRRIGICYDACHFAVVHEDAPAALDAMHAAGIRLSKIHLSNALRLDPANDEARSALAAFNETTYLHQVIGRRENGSLVRHRDIPDALAAWPDGSIEWRAHFHIPLFAEPAAPLFSTITHLEGLAHWLHAHPLACRHFEMETYTFDVLPPDLRPPAVEDMLAEEFRWCETRFFTLVGR